MNVDHKERDVLAQLAKCQREIEQVRALGDNLPEYQKLAELQSERSNAQQTVAYANLDTAHRDRQLKRLGDAISDLLRREKDSRQTLTVTEDPSIRRDLHKDVESAQRKRIELERERSQLESQQYDVEHERKSAAVAKADSLGDKIEEAEKNLEQATATTNRRITELEHQIGVLMSHLSDPVRELYTNQIEEHGVGAAVLQGGICGGCYMQLDNVTLSRFRTAAADELLRCPECGTIVLRVAADDA